MLKADLIFTDPPYNVDYTGGTSEALKIQNDKMEKEEFYNFLVEAFKNMYDILVEGGSFYIWCVDSEIDTFMSAIKNANLFYHETLIWNKNALVLGHLDYHKKHEPCLYGWKKGKKHYFVDSRMETSIIEDRPNINKMTKEQLKQYCKELLEDKYPVTIINEDKPLRNGEHPTMKPIKLVARLIRNNTIKKNTVVDLFGGSGSTLIACEQLNRICYTMELDPKYCDVIIKRWEALTGEKATKINVTE